jgi:small subunit ribosomal protein S17
MRGIVKSNKMDKTITVTVERLMKHPRYGKYVRRKASYKAHDSHKQAKVGDLVEIEETRPLSKTKNWRLVRIIKKASEVQFVAPQEPTVEVEQQQPAQP